MHSDYVAKFSWACTFLFVYSLAGEIFHFKIVKMSLTNSRRKTSPQLLDQPKYKLSLCQQINFHQIKLKMAANNMSNICISPDVLPTLVSLPQDNLYIFQQNILHDICRRSCLEVFCKKTALNTYAEFARKQLYWNLFLTKLQAGGACNFIKQSLQYRCFPGSFAEFLRTPILKGICERLLLDLKYYTPANNTAEAVAEYSKTATARGRNIVWN